MKDLDMKVLRVVFIVATVFATFFVGKAAYQERQVRRTLQSIAKESGEMEKTLTGVVLLREAQDKLTEAVKEMLRVNLLNVQAEGREKALKAQLKAAEDEIAQLKDQLQRRGNAQTERR